MKYVEGIITYIPHMRGILKMHQAYVDLCKAYICILEHCLEAHVKGKTSSHSDW